MVPFRRLRLLPPVLLLLGLGCAGSKDSADRAGQINLLLKIFPTNPAVVVGQSIQLAANSPWGNQALWTVQPASAGSIDGNGLFTAGASTGSCTIIAVWSQDVRYTASTDLLILPPPLPAVTSPTFVQAFGAQQASGTVANAGIAGETTPATTATSANLAVTIRHGFLPTVQ